MPQLLILAVGVVLCAVIVRRSRTFRPRRPTAAEMEAASIMQRISSSLVGRSVGDLCIDRLVRLGNVNRHDDLMVLVLLGGGPEASIPERFNVERPDEAGGQRHHASAATLDALSEIVAAVREQLELAGWRGASRTSVRFDSSERVNRLGQSYFA